MRTPSAPWARAAFVDLVALAILLLVALAIVTVRDADLSDFRCLYEAGRLVRLGEDPYDRATWAAAVASDPARLPPCNEAFVYPLWTAVLFSGASLVPVRVAVAVWEVATLLFLAASAGLLARAWRAPGLARPLLALVLLSQPAFSLVANAQLGGLVLLALAALSLALARRHATGASGAWLLLLVKPHVTIAPLVGALAASRRFAALAATGAAAVLAATLIVRPSWPVELAREIVAQRRLGDPGLDTLWGLAAALDLPGFAAPVAAAAAAATVWLALPRRRLDPRELLAALIPVSLVITPYGRAHDQVALAVAWGAALVAAEAAGARRARIVTATALVALALPWTLTALSQAGLPIAMRVLVPYASGLLVAYALPRDERLP